jgi:hypothetical protein
VSVPAEQEIDQSDSPLAERGDRRDPKSLTGQGGAVRIVGIALGLVVLLAAIALMRRHGGDLRTWLGQVWVLIAAIPLPFVAVALALKAAEVALNAAAWTTVLRTSYPEQPVAFRQTLGAVQGGVGIFAVIPPKFGGFAVLGLYRAAFPTLGISAVLATRVVQGISSTILGTVLLLLFSIANAGFGDDAGFLASVATFARERPLLAAALAALAVALVVALGRYGREWVRELWAQLALGGAILRTPGRYLALVIVPTLLAFALRWGVTGTLLAAFGIPVSWESLLRVNVSHGIARSVQIVPGGLGTTQAFDLVALQGLAPTETIVAYSLSQAAILLVFNILFGLVALTWAFGLARTARILRLPGRNADLPPLPSPRPGVS